MRIILPLIVFVFCVLLGHSVVINGIPGFIMGKAHQTFEAQGVPETEWVGSPRQSPQTQRIVRPSPDLAYAVCRFDTTSGPVFISAPTWDGYGSLSIFNDQTDNVFVADLGPNSDFTGIEVRRPAENSAQDALTLDGRGIALIRRLAPQEDAYETASALVAEAVCTSLE